MSNEEWKEGQTNQLRQDGQSSVENPSSNVPNGGLLVFSPLLPGDGLERDISKPITLPIMAVTTLAIIQQRLGRDTTEAGWRLTMSTVDFVRWQLCSYQMRTDNILAPW